MNIVCYERVRFERDRRHTAIVHDRILKKTIL